MERFRTVALCLMMLLLSGSCINKDILNVSDSVEINSRYSVPIGSYDTDINTYFESLVPNGPSSGDSLYYNDVLYPVDVPYVGFSFTDSLNFNLIRDPSGKVKSAEFILLFGNGYPTQVELQVYFMSGSSPVDSVFEGGPRVISPADLNSDGLVTDPSTSMVTIDMPVEFNAKVAAISGITVKGRIYLTRPDIRWVKFYPGYKFNLHIGARIELLFDTNQL